MVAAVKELRIPDVPRLYLHPFGCSFEEAVSPFETCLPKDMRAMGPVVSQEAKLA
jgi:hypothetical protein